MKKIMVSLIMCAFVAHSIHASSADLKISSVVSSASKVAYSSAEYLCVMIKNNPHIAVGLGLFMSRPLLGLITQAEEYSLARLAGLSIVSNQNYSQTTVNVGPLGLQAVTLTQDQVQENGMLSLNIALQEVQDPATSGSAYAISTKVSQKDDTSTQSVAQDSQDTLPDSLSNASEVQNQDNEIVDAIVNQAVVQGLQDALYGNSSNPALVQGIQDTIEGNAVWGLHVSANIGNYGVQGTVGLSDVVVAMLGAFAVVVLQTTGSSSSALTTAPLSLVSSAAESINSLAQ